MPWVTAAAVVAGAVMQSNASKKAAATQARSADAATNAQMEMFYNTDANLAPWRETGTLAMDELARLAGLQSPNSELRKPTRADAARIAEEGHRTTFGTGYTNDSDRGRIETAELETLDRLMAEYNAKLASTPQSQVPNPMTAPLTKPFALSDFQESPAYQFNLQQGQKAIEKSAAARKMYYAPATLQDISKYSQGVASNEFMNAYNMYNQNQKNIWDRLYAMSGSGQNAAAQAGAFGTQVGGQIGENMMGAGNAQAAGQIGSANAFAGVGNTAYNAYMMNQMLSNNQQSFTGSSLRGNPNMTGSGDVNQYMG